MESLQDQFKEKPRNIDVDGKYQVHYEGGDHGDGKHLAQKMEDLHNGNLDSSIWNREVGVKLGNYKPRAICIDSQIPGHFNSSLQDYDIPTKKWQWVGLPARPSRINGRDEVLLIKGDTHFPHWLLGLDLPQDQRNQFTKALSSELGMIEDREIKSYFQENEIVNKVMGAIGWGGVLSIIGGYASMFDKKNMTRSQFLHLLGTGMIGMSMAIKYGREKAPLMESINTDQHYDRIYEVLSGLGKDRITESTLLDGRTAMMISKLIEGMRQGLVPRGSHGATIMGFGHTHGAISLMSDPEARQKAVYNYAKTLIGVLDAAADKVPQIDRKASRDILLDLIAQAEIVTVTDPGTKNVDPKSVDNVINENVKYAGYFMTPEIVRALRPLRR